MSRLDDLKRQRASVAQHLDWLDREIADEAAKTGAMPDEPLAPEAEPAMDEVTTTAATADDGAGIEIPEEHAVEAQQRVADARRGCFVLFGAFLGAIALGTVLLYFLRYRH